MAKAELVARYPEHGKNIDCIRCVCGTTNEFYLWSWAGHGVAKCKGCGSKIKYGTLDVIKVGERYGNT